jgi:hypothetical protein
MKFTELNENQVRHIRVESSQWNPFVYANLYEFETAKKLGEKYHDDIDRLGAVIRAHELSDILCVTLLHKHFNLYSNERLVRHLESNELIIVPESSADITAEPFCWAFAKSTSSAPYKIYPVEFLRGDSSLMFLDDRRRVLESKHFIQDFLSALTSLGLTNLYGLSLDTRRFFAVTPDETLVENSAPNCRKLAISVIHRNKIPKEYTRTSWSF